jgi:hypothetical protein
MMLDTILRDMDAVALLSRDEAKPEDNKATREHRAAFASFRLCRELVGKIISQF